ncbi:MAG: thioredoxin domain-containing protein [Actinomycetes bacterium]
MNRLATSTSPYLLQHKDNPVDWFPWGEDAFAHARSRDVPILLSIGYSACHWCHVMAHESFEDDTTAAVMNERFVNVKVDREERPDVDAVYMDAVTTMTGHGGWPMTVFLTPEGRPFFAGTYYPRQRQHGLPAFTDVLVAVGETWLRRRDDVEQQGRAVVARLEQVKAVAAHAADDPPDAQGLSSALRALMRQYDHARGGFGDAPKFPPSMVLEFLLREHARSADPDALLMAEATMRAMATGGLYDQLGGGFARYSVDAAWVVPHFEKMLYDNALLARVYLHLWRSTGRPLGRRIALETADFIVGELGTAHGGFAAALDADSEGVEGLYYVWTPAQLVEALGAEDAAFAQETFTVTDEGTFEAGASTLQRRREPVDARRFDDVRRRLLSARDRRVRPGRDDKVVAAWNGLAIAALAEIGVLCDRPDLVSAAERAADLLLATHVVDGRLRRVSRGGLVGAPAGVLEDHADVAEGLFALYSATGSTRWLTGALTLLDVALEHFSDGEGGFFDTADDAEQLVRRPRDVADNAVPSGHAAVAGALLTAAAFTGSARYREAAARAVARVSRLAVDAPRFAGWSLAVAEALECGPLEVALACEPGDPSGGRLRRVAALGTSPGAALAWGPPGGSVPLLSGRPLIDGRAAAYVCRRFVCEAPTTSEWDLATVVGTRPELVDPARGN